MIRNGVRIDDSFAEAFPMAATGIIVTAPTRKWANQAAATATGYATSVIGCDCEAGVDAELSEEETPDGRPGVRLLFFAFSAKGAEKALVNRVGQCILTCPGTALYSAFDGDLKIKVGDSMRQFGDKWQTSKAIDGRRFWRVPVMDGEFTIEDTCGFTTDAVGGGNLLILGRDRPGLLETTEAAVAAIAKVPDVITPFPGGIVRSGSKVGSKYKGAIASTNNAFCPTLRGTTKTELDADTIAVLEIVIDGLTSKAVADAMRAGLKAVTDIGAAKGVTRVSAGNYGGKLGQHHYHLKDYVA
jgi:formylmethanofuran--tetrahydromethanopterin N-formyltransferase